MKLLAPGTRPAVVKNLLQFVQDYDLDGLDIDLEWEVMTAIDTAGEYVPFTQELSDGLKKQHKLLTCATASNPGGMVPLGSVPYFDYINVMSYDSVGTSPQGVIYGPPGGEHASMDMARHDMQVWLDLGVPKERLVLGVPFYGKAFGAYKGVFHDYRDLLTQYGPATAENDLIDKPCPTCSYITYNGRPTVRAKAQLRRSRAPAS
ncbi:MAG: glycosyl hydrolase family 18 protein [Asticcacaulis sp.]